MPNDDIEILFQSLDQSLKEENSEQLSLLKLLMDKTLTFRDQLKEEGLTLTVADTRIALDTLNSHINNRKFPLDLTSIQNRLAKLLIDTFILFKYPDIV